ncbi:hypothetical protein Taro_007496 [Colocasia esculenta]|uniref:Uncharacterized protein n=1 Tax=Colocasia esculenta TaxID=4460 RepID=A0A843TYB8_COLES|nr:hypothetical protein [Colocasia esculenta]
MCLVSVGVIGLAFGRPVLLVALASVFSRFRGPVPGCQPVMAPACVAPRPGGVCAEHCFRFVPDSVGFYGSRVGTGNPYWALFARLTPLLLSARGSSSRELGVRRVEEAAVAPCCVRLPCMIRERVTGYSCCCAACVASVVARRVRAVASRLALDSLAVALLVWRTLASQSSCGLWSRSKCPGLVGCPLVVGVCVVIVVFGLVCLCAVVRYARDAELSSLALTGWELWLRCIAWLPCVLVEVSQNFLLWS